MPETGQETDRPIVTAVLTPSDPESLPAVDRSASPGPVAATPAPAGKKGAGERLEYSRARQTVTRRIAESKATIPHIYLGITVSMDAAEAMREELKAGGGEDPVPTVTDLVIRAAAHALTAHPRVNSTYRDGGLNPHSRVNIGFAVDTGDGSLTPVIPDADRTPLNAIAAATRSLAARARSGELTPPEQAGATFTISNLGMLGIETSLPVVNPGQSAKLAVGAIREQPVVREGLVTVGRVMTLDLCCDHRVLHGGEAARFLTAIGDRLERPEELLG